MGEIFILILTLTSNGATIAHVEFFSKSGCEEAGKLWLASVNEAEEKGNFSNTKASYICAKKK